MHSWLAPYEFTVIAMVAIAALLLVQLIVLDIAGIRSGHVPGAPVKSDHGSFLFRAVRAHANTNESIVVFVILAVAAILSSSSPTWTNIWAWLYVVSRFGHMLCYYANFKIARSVSFAVSIVALILLLSTVIATLF
ncbi:MAG: MAPEG family protein [Alcanivoracaceae bacterium]|jgi:uncharacterized MAPEG superfamily protein|nr:MAPEG family protein [Alcanivoracaceae bacterium]